MNDFLYYLQNNFDFPILYFIQENMVNPILNSIMLFFTHLGEFGIIWFLISIIMIFNKKYRRCGILMICSMALAFILGEICIKNVVCRVRPCYQDTTINMLIEKPKGYSFPSSHSSTSFAMMSASIYYNRKLGFALLPIALIICFSRLYLFVHFPSDVIGGALLGTLSAVIVLLIYNFFIKDKLKSKNKLEKHIA